ncbi:unnamed protein product, partial [Gulo gulo]
MAPGRSLVHKVVSRSRPLGRGQILFWAQFATFYFSKPCLTPQASLWQTQLRTSLSICWGSLRSNLFLVPLPEGETRELPAEARLGVLKIASVQTTGAAWERTEALARLVVWTGNSQMPTERLVCFLLFISPFL